MAKERYFCELSLGFLYKKEVTMRWIDTHAHLFHECFRADMSAVLQRAEAVGIEAVYMPSLDVASLPDMYALEKTRSPRCYTCVGLHPCYVGEDADMQLDELEVALRKRPAAIGETGLDAQHEVASLLKQEAAFRRHCYWAKRYNLPLLLHSRGTTAELLKILREEKLPEGGVLHCFSGTYEEAVAAIDLGFFIGIGGVITYKSGGELREIVKKIPLSSLVLETDAPYLAPTGSGSRRNEPSFLPLTGKVLAKRLQLPQEEVARQTTANALKLFKQEIKTTNLTSAD